MYFCYFIIISPWKRAGPFIWTNLNSPHPKILCAKIGWNWMGGSGEKDFLKFVNTFLLFHNYLPPWKRVGPFVWTKLNHFTQWYFVPSSVEIDPVVLEKRMKMWKVNRQTDGQWTTGFIRFLYLPLNIWVFSQNDNVRNLHIYVVTVTWG